ncbi:MAG: asparagine synthase (glutamine-hydrolyzing) [Candidatus Omnitrophica bacterium]|nr:asparagine synthase (glutamine-hydrolyzing) [Candidatus Omnitrophota bacterium]
MCGFVGFVGHHDDRLLERMNARIAHRGPDDVGYFSRDNVNLGHRRLSVLDLSSAGHQPMSNEDGTIWLAYNGEIYNFRQLREILLKKGHKFKSRSDTETIIHGYEEWGIEIIKKLNGMFAFAIYDSVKKKVILARDRIGEKPLFYAQVGKHFYFASEIQALLQVDELKAEVDRQSLIYYLMLGYIPFPNSIIKGIFKLPASHYLEYKDAEVKVSRYWEITYSPKEQKPLREEFYCQRVRSLFEESVKNRLIADVPLGVFLSGGIDSSLVLAFASKNSSQPVKAFSIGFSEDTFNELKYAKQVAEHCGAKHYEFILKYDALYKILPEIMGFFGEPVADPSFLPTYLLAKLTRQYVTVALGGDGCDESFAGYVTHKNVDLANMYFRLPHFLKNATKRAVDLLPVSHKYMSFDFKAKGFISGMDHHPIWANFLWLGAFSPPETMQMLKKEYKHQFLLDRLKSLGSTYLREHENISLLDKILFFDMRYFLQDDLLVKTDLMSMAHALEVRAPFLDYDLLDFVTRMPSKLKVKGAATKYILKKAMSDMLPAAILKRKKQGFSIPVAEWLSKPDVWEFVQEVFNKEKIEREGFFDYQSIDNLLKEHIAKKRNNWRKIWALLIFELWFERNIKGRTTANETNASAGADLSGMSRPV